MTTPHTLTDWLAYLESQHPVAIDMGLERVRAVWLRMGQAIPFPVIAVGGTNGKGSVCAMLSTIYRTAGFKVGTYTSPHLLRYNERVAVNLQPLDDAALCRGFAAVEQARGDISLTYFEFGTLAAMWNFIEAGIDVAVLEIGLGGRLDAVNVFESDCAIVTSIGIDHVEFLGGTREAISAEKAGIFRAGKPALCGDTDPPAPLLAHAAATHAELHCLGRDFTYEAHQQQWDFRWGSHVRLALPYPALRGRYQLANASVVLAALHTLQPVLPVTMSDIRTGLLTVELPGRFQVLPGRPVTVLDVAHNPHAAVVLARNLDQLGFAARTFAVCGMMRDKDRAGVLACLKDKIDVWLVCDLDSPRAAAATTLRADLHALGISEIHTFDSAASAWRSACEKAAENDRIVVFGSFYTVADVLQARQAADNR
jgi:dihydrofolate synthase/folylpolyglutamate synthase